MDETKFEEQLLEVIHCTELNLVENSLKIEKITDGKVNIKLQYCETTLEVIVVKEKDMLDFVIVESDIAPMELFDEEFPPDYPRTSLRQLLNWILLKVKLRMKENIQVAIPYLGYLIDKLLDEKVINDGLYEVILDKENDKAVLLLKMRPSKEMRLSKVVCSKNNNVQNSSQQYILIKFVFQVSTGQLLAPDLGIFFSTCLTNSFPQLLTFNPKSLSLEDQLKKHSLEDCIKHVKTSVDTRIMEARDGWKQRSKLLCSLYQVFKEEDVALPFLDAVTMTKIQLAFVLPAGQSVMLELKLSCDYPQEDPKFVIYLKKAGEDVIENSEVSISSGITPTMTTEEAVARVMKLIEKIVSSLAEKHA